MINVKKYEFPKNNNPLYGSLTAVEALKDVPFDIKRVYYVYDVPDKTRRGFHSHSDLHQMLICVHGSVKILTKTPFEEETCLLSSANKGLYIGPMIWREMCDFTDDAVLLVLASEYYTQDDYIRDYNRYELLARDYFERNCK